MVDAKVIYTYIFKLIILENDTITAQMGLGIQSCGKDLSEHSEKIYPYIWIA